MSRLVHDIGLMNRPRADSSRHATVVVTTLSLGLYIALRASPGAASSGGDDFGPTHVLDRGDPASGPNVVTATAETDAVPSSGDAADDAAIWVHPDDPSRSTIIATDKKGGLVVYDLQGHLLHSLPLGKLNNVDLRYNFPLEDELIDIVVASDRSRNAIAVYQVTRHDRSLAQVSDETIPIGVKAYGICMYESPLTDRFYAFTTGKRGRIEQWELSDNGHGKVRGALVRKLRLRSQAEGCVADDELGHLYIGEERAGIWKFDAEPTGAAEGILIDSTGRSGHLTRDVEGLTLYYAGDGEGYLLASSQGSGEFVIYQRGGSNAYVMSFRISTGAVDAVDGTDGIDVLGFNLGARFPNGVFIAQDGTNSRDGSGEDRRIGSNQNFKLVPWEVIANANGERPLIIDNTRDPRGLRGPRQRQEALRTSRTLAANLRVH